MRNWLFFIFLLNPAISLPVFALEPGDTFKDCSDCPEMVVVPPGSFLMGGDFVSDYGENGAFQVSMPIHEVSIDYPFAVSRVKITVDQYKLFSDENGLYAFPCGILGEVGVTNPDGTPRTWENPGFSQEGDHPVVCINWASAQEYVRWLNKKTGQTYRLLSEAEWEYIARASQPEDVLKNLATNEHANIGGEEGYGPGMGGNDTWDFTSPGTAFPPNPFGVYDLNGNALELVGDCVNGDYVGAPDNGQAWKKVERINWWSEGATSPDLICIDHIGRGMAWNFPSRERWFYQRSWWRVHTAQNFVGFRIMRLLAEEKEKTGP